MTQEFYITTPIYYVNAKPHIGHAYTSIVADIFIRFHKLIGDDCYFLTGTDEHGQKIATSAREKGTSPQELCDEVSKLFQDLLPELHIENDQFIRTTDESHKKIVQQALQDVYDKGLIYKKDYSGKYCQGCERYLDEGDLDEEGCCKDHLNVPEEVSENNYFFKMSQFQDQLIQHIEDNPTFITPEQYRNETLGFLKEPLQDMCISRHKDRLTWGVEIPFDTDFVTYVWFDALLNYCSALGYKGNEKFEKYWPEVHHLLAKDIVKTHCVYWPTMLMALDIPMPKRFLVHGYWLMEDTKISKSLGNAVSPLELKDEVGADPLRYFLAAAMTFGRDANFTMDLFRERYNADLANNLGNLVSRSLTLTVKNFDSKIPVASVGEKENELFSQLQKLWQELVEHIKNFQLGKAANTIPAMCGFVNRYIDEHEPWKMAKEEDKKEDLARVLKAQCESVRFIAGAIQSFMPEISQKILDCFGLQVPTGPEFFELGVLEEGSEIKKCPPLFPRISGK